ncbi:hypothetical protein EMIT0P260_20503 [Pseudomonas sp. IT-P260]
MNYRLIRRFLRCTVTLPSRNGEWNYGFLAVFIVLVQASFDRFAGKEMRNGLSPTAAEHVCIVLTGFRMEGLRCLCRQEKYNFHPWKLMTQSNKLLRRDSETC